MARSISAQLQDRLTSLAPRERAMVLAAAALTALVLIYFVVFYPLHVAVESGAKRLARKQQDLAWMHSIQGELQSLNSFQPGSSNESLVVVIDRSARESGLASALTGQTPSSDHSIQVRLESAPFDTVVRWMGTLQQRYGLAVDTATIDRGAKPGLVNATVLLTRPR